MSTPISREELLMYMAQLHTFLGPTIEHVVPRHATSRMFAEQHFQIHSTHGGPRLNIPTPKDKVDLAIRILSKCPDHVLGTTKSLAQELVDNALSYEPFQGQGE